jgi:Spy/CpxP family protein refolding chaperone
MIFVLAAFAIAQTDRECKRKKVTYKGAAIAQQLGLSQEQQEQIKSILRQYRIDIKSVLQSSYARDQKIEKIKALKDKTASAIDALLTPEQREKARQIGLTERLLNLRNHNRVKMLWVMKELNLTQDQKESVKAIIRDTRTQIKAIKENSSLTPEAKRAKLVDIRNDSFEKIRSLLTPEQLRKMEELQKTRSRSKPLAAH